ncbi:HAMP domain-containing protein [Halomonas sp. ISL-60]|uniref:methyl-accepting chemotaxis protein n=1 Tax=Halomonas sp. ISL-56 TaxID=2819149 RepID=UPI001BECA71B|nr:methyl-accepting chemotaxis protein [Halomonas sp. ISL-56]MBT2774633.1 HAMP domain-containing protein [Halomonas sp. ISL-60]MBT2801265.1 HAMP domain-containing protein [Halomonas sp. ISL-56]
MKKTLSIRAMLISLFLAAVLGAIVLAATGWVTNQRLIDSQRYIIGEVLPLEDASRGMVLTMGGFGQRHADLLAAESVTALDEATAQSELDERFRTAQQALSGIVVAGGLSELDSHYQALLEGDTALERVRREELSLQVQMAERISAMQALVSQVMLSAENIAGRAALAQVRSRQEQRELMGAWREDGMTTLPTQLLDNMFTTQADIGRLSGNARMALAQLSDLGRQMMQTGSADALVNLRYNEIAQQVGLARQSLAAIAEAPSTGVEQRALILALDDVIVELEGLMVSDDNAVYELRLQQLAQHELVKAALTSVAQATNQMRDALSDVEAYTVGQADSAATQAETLANAGRTLLIMVTLAVIALLAIFGWRTMVRVLGPLVAMRQQMESISGAAGENADLSKRLELKRNDEVGQTAHAFNNMMETFEGMVAQIRESSEAIAASSRQIAAGNENLSQRTDQQAASLAETASSLEQITATVKQTAEYADQAKDASGNVDQRARAAGDVSTRTTAAMGDIREASEKITSIIKAIDDIAFQTNLLALNASVEAARAGEQGRGFAVVAQEVRKLAGRSAEEAAQIRHLVDDSVAKVSEGEQLVNASSKHLQEIIDSLSEVTRYVTEIAGATHEQSAGIDQINQAISQLDQVTHQNARLVQEATTASHTLDDRAGDMHSLVGRFHVSDAAGQRHLALPQQQEVTQ